MNQLNVHPVFLNNKTHLNCQNNHSSVILKIYYLAFRLKFGRRIDEVDQIISLTDKHFKAIRVAE